MCGIFGLTWHRDTAVPKEEALRQTARLLQHRGPDGTGAYSGPGVALVHCRLALLDLTDASLQPFWDRSKRYALVYNGEIYNFVEIRDALRKLGVAFRTSGDTEVLLEALLTWGPEAALPKLEGMFAFGLYDTHTQSFLLARDPFGIKPLFVYDQDDAFIFSSEIGAMRPWVRFKPDVLSISGFLQGFAGPTRGCTFLEKIKYLDPGSWVRIRKGSRSEYGRFFSIAGLVDDAAGERYAAMSDDERVELTDQLLHESVRSQLVADAPVGALCSGGVDSSLILSIAKIYEKDLTVYHANVLGNASEQSAAKEVARHVKVGLRSIDIRSQDFLERLPQVIQHYGLPFTPRPHSVPFLIVSELARATGVKAVLSGEGSDEVFLGYSSLAPDLRPWLRPRTALRKLWRWLRDRPNRSQPDYEGLSYVGGVNPRLNTDLVLALHSRFEVLEEARQVRSELTERNSPPERGLLPSMDLLHYNLRSLLLRNDLMGMAAGIECRFPFLDTRLVRAGLNLPYNSKIRFSIRTRDAAHPWFCDKWIIRKVAARYLPARLSQREKKPFPVDAYSPARLQIREQFFAQSFVAEIFDLSSHEMHYLLQKAGHELKFRLMQLEIWNQVCLRGSFDRIVPMLKDHVSIAGS